MLALVFVLLLYIKPLFGFNLILSSLDRGWVYYPPLADDEIRKWQEDREGRAKLEREMENRSRDAKWRGEERQRGASAGDWD